MSSWSRCCDIAAALFKTCITPSQDTHSSAANHLDLLELRATRRESWNAADQATNVFALL